MKRSNIKFIGLCILLHCIVACQYNSKTKLLNKVQIQNSHSGNLVSLTEDTVKLLKNKFKPVKENKFFKYKEGCYYNIVLKGAVYGKAADFISITKLDPFSTSIEQKISIDEDKKFNASIAIDEPGYYKLLHKQNSYVIYLTPGNVVEIDINHATDQGLTFLAGSKAANNFLRCSYMQQKIINKTTGDDLLLRFEEFKKIVDYERDIMDNQLTEAIEGADSISVEFVELERANIDFYWALKHLKYQKHNLKDPRATYHSDGKYLNKLSFKDEFLMLASFRNFVYNYFDFFSEQYIEDTYGEEGKYEYSPEERAEMRYNRINFTFEDEHVRNFIKTKLISETIENLHEPLITKLPTINKLVAKLKKEVNNGPYISYIEECYHKNIPVDDGTIAPDFFVKNAEGESLQLEDLKGKWAYIAVWASWCAPCKIEQPHLEILKQEYSKNNNIEILSVSIDKEKERWKSAIGSSNITEPQYIAPGNWNSEFASAFNLTSVPKYILIDPDGQINDLSTSKPSADIRLKFDQLGI